MSAAVVIACIIMYVSSGRSREFVAEHPNHQMLALAVLVLSGSRWCADGVSSFYSCEDISILHHCVFGPRFRSLQRDPKRHQ